MTRINLNQKVPSHLAFLLMIVLSCLLSWFTVSEGKKVAEDAKNSPAFDVTKRMENNNLIKSNNQKTNFNE